MAVAVFAISPLTAHLPLIAALAIKAGVGAGAYLGWLALFHRTWLTENVRFVLERH